MRIPTTDPEALTSLSPTGADNVTMTIQVSGAAKEELFRQVNGDYDYGYNLHLMWRAAGSPEGKDPHTWLELAAPLVKGFRLYFKNLGVPGSVFDSLSWRQAKPIGPGEEPGDIAAIGFLADIYANYVDDPNV